MDDILIYSIIVYILLLVIVIIVKPKILYSQQENDYKNFGFTKNKTFLPFPLCCSLLALLSYLFVMLYFKIEL